MSKEEVRMLSENEFHDIVVDLRNNLQKSFQHLSRMKIVRLDDSV